MSGPDSVGGGSGRHFQVTTDGDQSNSLNSTKKIYTSGPPQRNNINSLQKENIYQKFGGHGPRTPPPGYATVYSPAQHVCSKSSNTSPFSRVLAHRDRPTTYSQLMVWACICEVSWWWMPTTQSTLLVTI